MQQVIELLVKCDKAGIRGSLTAAAVLLTDDNGSTLRQLADRLNLGEGTVKYHLRQAVARGWLEQADELRRYARVYYPTRKGHNLKGILC